MSNEQNKPAAPGTNSAITGTGRPIPRGIEVLLKKAAVDPEFRQLLLQQRGGAAAALELELEPAEISMLNAIPAEQLAQLINQTSVPETQPPVLFRTYGLRPDRP